LGKGSPNGTPLKAEMFVVSNKAQAKEDRIIYNKKTGALYYDADGIGSTTQVKFAIISKVNFFYHDFFVV
jgi:Ca2+-binding RTX toxin-like protein